MTIAERRANDARIESHIRELEQMAHKSPFFAQLLADLKILRSRLAEANRDLTAIAGFTFQEVYTGSDGDPIVDAGTKVMMFNRNAISEDEARKILDSERFYDSRVVLMDACQAKNLFPYLQPDTDDKEDEDGKE